MQPVPDKRTGVGCLPRLLPQSVFPDGERAYHIQPGLYDYEADCAKVDKAEPRIPGPAPPPDKTGDDEDQTEHHKEDKQGVNDQQTVGGKQ